MRAREAAKSSHALVDALGVTVHRDEAGQVTSALIVSGINEEGMRERLGL
jgi:hypothetical protein